MILCIGQVLDEGRLAELRQRLAARAFVDGTATAGWHAKLVKHNRQAEGGPETQALQAEVAQALARHELFQLACRPRRMRPVLFSRYEPGMEYGSHVDDAVMGSTDPIRSDVSFTLFLNPPDAYDGGELVIEIHRRRAGVQAAGRRARALPFLDPASRGAGDARRAAGAVSWVQSQIRDPGCREILFDLDTARRTLFQREGKSREFDLLSKSLANLLRLWAEL